MTDNKEDASKIPPRPSADAAFELWLERSMHGMYDSVAAEPVPPELIALIETHKKKQ